MTFEGFSPVFLVLGLILMEFFSDFSLNFEYFFRLILSDL